ncbi:UDP-3-O-acyl-N-acetylglucosamine deacetylase [Candidatus Desulfarcum epimagneticum]|uniref:UDP-3-O-acyl-N-acetylglucosamine deacetylase n=1 Tax=uncultured Desulfobacteraceae bacterium TaxID=218296 RepID=A0A484HK83_9BACT|nr:UDP-3-O-acyl-N-acetylglucosamine deacetylase [uncultured Desulfobacteraceae bacterium]
MRPRKQTTIENPVSCSGVGVHSGREAHVTFKPAPANQGVRFVRTDLPDCPGVKAHFNMIVDTSLATVIGENGMIVSTVEHLMASFFGLGIDNITVETDSYEIPIMDGSAGPFTDVLKSAGFKTQEGSRSYFVVKKPLVLEENGKSVAIYPSSDFRITCDIDYDHPRIRRQSFSSAIDNRIFEKEVCRARTFGFLEEVETLKSLGLARGGSLDNAVVVDKHDILNQGGLRFEDEFVRHKTLDCIGDFSLLGMPIMGHIVTKKSGHAFHHAFLKEFFASKDSWETRTIF